MRGTCLGRRLSRRATYLKQNRCMVTFGSLVFRSAWRLVIRLIRLIVYVVFLRGCCSTVELSLVFLLFRQTWLSFTDIFLTFLTLLLCARCLLYLSCVTRRPVAFLNRRYFHLNPNFFVETLHIHVGLSRWWPSHCVLWSACAQSCA